nr:MAG TPA: hypothetical protein [Caudoviricetes sp.]
MLHKDVARLAHVFQFIALHFRKGLFHFGAQLAEFQVIFLTEDTAVHPCPQRGGYGGHNGRHDYGCNFSAHS